MGYHLERNSLTVVKFAYSLITLTNSTYFVVIVVRFLIFYGLLFLIFLDLSLINIVLY